MSTTAAAPRSVARHLLDKARQAHLAAIRRAVDDGMSRIELQTGLDAFANAAEQIVGLG